ncbi:MAG: hypothetical protein KC621_05740 [Myxococcales bacterium]|nr:hypothetical protein [Myxococcales bacterium]
MWWILLARAWGRDWSAADATALTEVLADPDLAVGDLIELGATTFTGPFLVPPGIELRGISTEQTVFDAPSGTVIEVQGPAPTAGSTTLSRLTVSGGNVARAVLARHDLVLDHVRLVAGVADTGGLVRVEGTVTLDVQDSTFSGGYASSEGGQIWLDVGSTALVSGSTLVGGRADGAGGAIAANAAALVVSDSLLTGHTSSGHGGALALTACQTTFQDAVVSRSEAGADNRGGGLWVSGGSLELTRTVLEDDVARDGGGAWLGDDATVTLTDTELRGNVADREGGGLYVASLQALTASGLAVVWNRAGGGAGVFVDGCCTTPFVIREARLCSNAIEDRGFYGYSGTDPRGGHARLVNATGVFEDVLWLDGAATSSDDSQIGALSIEGGAVDLVHQVFAWNRSPSYAAVRVRDSAVVDLRNTLFAWNVGAPVLTDDAGSLTLAYAAFAGNDGPSTQPDTLLDETSLPAVDPGFQPGPDACDATAWLAPESSPLHDAGDPALQDADGSRSDIGLSSAGGSTTGGPQLDPDEPFRRDCGCGTAPAPGVASPAVALLLLSAWRRRARARRSTETP